MKRSIFISLISVLIFLALDKIFFKGDYLLACFLSLIPGFVMVLFQKKNRSWEFLPSLITGSLIYGFLSMAVTETMFYFALLKSEGEIPPGFSNILQAALITALIFFVASFMGGLLAIVIKGFRVLIKNKNQKLS